MSRRYPLVPRVVLALMLAVLALLGCPRGGGASDVGTLPPIHTDDPVAEADLREADASADAGHLDEARAGYEGFLRDHPSDPLVPLAQLGLARVLIDAGTPEAALPVLAPVIASDDAVIAERGQFWQGIALHLAGQSAEAIVVLGPLRGRTTDPEESYLLLQTLAAAGRATHDHVTSLVALDELIRTRADEAERAEARARAQHTVESELLEADVPRAYDTLPRDGEVWSMVGVRALHLAYEHGDVAAVRAVATDLESRGVALPDDARALLERTARLERADPRVIGAVLPLSGEGRDVGRHALEGLMLAAGSPSDGPAAPDAPQLVFRDDGGDPARAAAAVEELITVHSAIAIIGPLTGPTARAAAERAAALGVPMITLTPVSAGSASPLVFQLFPSLAEEADALVAAARARGASQIAVLHPVGGYGAAMRSAIEAAVTRAGASYAGAESYEMGTTTFGPVITRLSARTFDAVVIADTESRIALIAPALAAAGITQTSAASTRRPATILIPSAGFDVRLVRTAGRYLQGAIFGTLFSAALAEGEARSFVDSYTARFGAPPDAFAAYAHDAFMLIRRGVLSGRITRTDMSGYLPTTSGASTFGASGGLGTTRHPSRALRLVTLSGETFTPIR